MEELKPCPFCGGRVYIKTSKYFQENKHAYQIICPCGMAKTLAYPTPEEAAKAWNTRTKKVIAE